MTPEEQRIAIAEACGWKEIRNEEIEWADIGGGGRYDAPAGRLENVREEIPDYPNDLNAMHEAERWLEKETGASSVNCLIRDYWLTLMEMMNPGVELWDNGTFLGKWSHAIKVGGATADQRAEAFLKTIGKWKD